MKRNITVNLFGTLYPMDEDAYELLKRYTDDMRAYFRQQEGGDDTRAKKRLYRDVDHKLLGGVMSGLGCYLDVNPMWLRLLAVILAFGSYGTAFIIYLICWIIIPPATTPAARLEMKGDPVNPYSLGDEILNGARNAMNSVKGKSLLDSVFQIICSILKVIIYIAGAGILLVCGSALLAALIGICWYMLSPLGTAPLSNSSDLEILQALCSPALLWMGMITLIISLALTLYIVVHLMLRGADRAKPMSATAKWVCVASWIISVALCCGCWIRMAYILETNTQRIMEYRNTRHEEAIAKREQQQLDALVADGWRVARARNLNGKYISHGRHYTGNRAKKYLNAWNENGDMVYEVVRDVKTAPGNYTLEAIARTDGNGCEIFAMNGSGKRYCAAVPVCDNVGGSVWAEAKAAVEADTTGKAGRARLKKIAQVNDGKGYGWSGVKISHIKVGADSLITYGVTNCSPTATWDGTWLSATAFRLIPE